MKTNAFSYNEVEDNCILPQHPAMEMTKATSQRWSFTELLRLRSPLDSGQTISHHCGLISTRNWKVDGVDDDVLYQDDCDYDKGFDIGNPQRLDNFYQCALHCLIFNVLWPCTHFSYNRNNGIRDMKFVPRVTDRETIGVREKKNVWFHSKSIDERHDVVTFINYLEVINTKILCKNSTLKLMCSYF